MLAGRRAGDTEKAAAPVRRPSRPSPTTDPLILLLPRAVATISLFDLFFFVFFPSLFSLVLQSFEDTESGDGERGEFE